MANRTRRCAACGQPIAGSDGLFLDQESGVVGRKGYQRLIRLSPMRMRLLTTLHNANGRFVARASLFDALYGLRPYADQPNCPETLDVMLHFVRKAIEHFDLEIVASYGFGWALRDLTDHRTQTVPDGAR